MKKIIWLIVLMSFCKINAQDCSSINSTIDANFTYLNKIEDLELPFNKTWNIALENNGAILVFLKKDSDQATAGIVKNKNGYYIKSAHEINESLVLQLVKKMGINLDDRKMADVKLKNIPAKQIEYNHKVYNLGDTYLMSGIMYMIVNDSYTYVFMFNCQRSLKSCYIPFFKEVMKNTYFGQDWY